MPSKRRTALYLRMSTEQQDMSIDQQEAECRRYASVQGYEIIALYRDEGLSGSKHREKRVAFLRMLRDVAKRQFDLILCYDLARFSRSNSLKLPQDINILTAHDCRLVTVRDGEFDTETFGGRMGLQFKAEMAHEVAVNQGRLSLRGREYLFDQGINPNGALPYGYDREYTSPQGQTYRIPRQEKFPVVRGWRRQVTKNEEEAKIVLWLYESFAERLVGLGELARSLNGRGIPKPSARSKYWTQQTIRKILLADCYIGIGGIGRVKTAKEAFARATPREKEGMFPVIVPRPLWEKVRAKLLGRAKGKTRISARSSLLTGFVRCQFCGDKMYSSRNPHRSKKGSYYYCSRPAVGASKTNCNTACFHEYWLLPQVCDFLLNHVDRKVLSILDREFKETNPDERATLVKTVNALEAKAEAAANKWAVESDPKITARLRGVLDRLEADLKEAKASLEEFDLTASGPKPEFAKWWGSAKQIFAEVASKSAPMKEAVHVLEGVTPEEMMKTAAEYGSRIDSNGDTIIEIDAAKNFIIPSDENLVDYAPDGFIRFRILPGWKVGLVAKRAKIEHPIPQPDAEVFRAFLDQLGFRVFVGKERVPTDKDPRSKSGWRVLPCRFEVEAKLQYMATDDRSCSR